MQFRLPFISRNSHSAILATKDEVIAELRAQVAYIAGLREDDRADRARLDARLTELVEKSLTPPPAPAPEEKPRKERLPEPRTLDLSMVDPNDTETIAALVAREIPPGSRVNGSALMAQVERMKRSILNAHAEREARAVVPATVSTASPEAAAAAISQAEQVAQRIVNSGE